jgi:hypothetical protein
MNLIASLMIAMEGFLGLKKQLKKNQEPTLPIMSMKKKRLIETRFAQVGAVLLSLGFATQIWGLAVVLFEKNQQPVLRRHKRPL